MGCTKASRLARSRPSSWAFSGWFQTVGSSSSRPTSSKRARFSSRSKIPPQAVQAGLEIVAQGAHLIYFTHRKSLRFTPPKPSCQRQRRIVCAKIACAASNLDTPALTTLVTKPCPKSPSLAQEVLAESPARLSVLKNLASATKLHILASRLWGSHRTHGFFKYPDFVAEIAEYCQRLSSHIEHSLPIQNTPI